MAKKDKTIQQIDSDYTPKGDSLKIQNQLFIARKDTSVGRAYYNMGAEDNERDYIYSATTILNVLDKGYGFKSWLKLNGHKCDDIMNEAADKGTFIHVCNSILAAGEDLPSNIKIKNTRTGEDEEITPKIAKNIEAFIKFYRENNPVIMGIEIMLYDVELPFAGTVDYIMVLKDKKDPSKPRLSIVDLKTGKEYPKFHELQLTCYKMLFDKIYGGKFGEIDDLYCLYTRDTGNYTLKKYKYCPEEWTSCVHLFHYMNSNARGKMPTIKEDAEYPEYYTLKEEKNDGK